MIIAFEGIDGVGKSETAAKTAAVLQFEIPGKPMRMLFDRYRNGFTAEILDSLNDIKDNVFWAMLLGCAQYYQSETIKGRNVILDRYLPSNYYQHSDGNTEKLFDYLVEICVKPDLTVVLYATPEERRRRIIKREGCSGDLTRLVDDDLSYDRIKIFLEKYNMDYLWIDTTEMPLDEVVERIVERVRTALTEA